MVVGIPEGILTYLYEAAYEKKHGYHDYKWIVRITVPAGVTIRVDMYIPKDEVWMEKGYDLDVEVLDKFKLWHYHDGRPQFEELLITETCLSLPYTKPEIVETLATIYIKNEDTVDRWIECVGHYRVIPRLEWEKVKEAMV